MVDVLRKHIQSQASLDIASSAFSLFAFSEIRNLLSKAATSIVGRKEERSVASLFSPGGTHAIKGEFQGINDFEVVAYLVVLPEAPGRQT